MTTPDEPRPWTNRSETIPSPKRWHVCQICGMSLELPKGKRQADLTARDLTHESCWNKTHAR